VHQLHDIPRQHPRLEILDSMLYLTHVHGLRGGQRLGCRRMLDRVFRA